MKHAKLTLLTSVALMGLGVGTLYANDYGFTSHYMVSEVESVKNLNSEDKLIVRKYLNYEEREKCQNYRVVPNGLNPDRCVRTQKVSDMGIHKVIMSYEIHFAFDSTEMDVTAQRTIDQIVNDIQKYSPSEIVVAGYTDSSGSDDYNVLLSQRRSDIVSNMLTNRGVVNRRIDQEAHGENNQAVATNNGVMLRENRRTVIEFRK